MATFIADTKCILWPARLVVKMGNFICDYDGLCERSERALPSICFPATEQIVLFVSEAGAYNPPYCGNVAVV